MFHSLFYYAGNGVIEFIRRFAVLEINIRILSRALLMRMFRIKRACPELSHRVIIYQFSHILIINHFNFLNFMGSAEAVKEMQERHFGFKRRKMSNKG